MSSTVRILRSIIITFSVLIGVQRVASAQLLVTTDTRCASAVGVTVTQATARYQWALFCHNNVPPPPQGVTYTPEKWLTAASITDYNNPVNAAIESRMFPIYYDAVFGTIWNAPDVSTTACTVIPVPASNIGLCLSGCYMPGTALQFADGPVDIKVAQENGKVDLVTLAPTATLDNLQYLNNKVERYTADYVEEWQMIYTLSMSSGGSLRVTDEHPLLTSDGIIHQAKSLKRGDKLIRANGRPDPIVRIEVNNVFTKVYNLKPVTTDYTSNIVVAGGYLNGSVRYQNEFLDTINSLILRRALTAQVDWFTSN
jgi:hypothetical protein